MVVARTVVGAASALTVFALSGCSLVWNCEDTTAERGEAGVSVEVEDTSGRPMGVTAEVVDWRLGPHPQVPDEGDHVHFRLRFDGADATSRIAVDLCAVDKGRVAVGCRTVHSEEAFGPNGDRTADIWLAVDHPEQVADVLVIPNDQSYVGRTCEEDLKDGGGQHPPAPAVAGDQL
ncbi:hypothetical protein ACIRIU_29625 [Streptomyces sp. NPDC102351]|uniref:hypothetical protein n=1 Tax=Streptomyces sp. NPDC102351 TaxID=3366158 RepID=UPI00381251C4